jgi:hypothetical protein
MTTESEIFAEVKNTYKSYDSEGLIDDISLRRWMRNELKRFGNNIMIYSDDIVKVMNGKGKLPEDFWHLQYAERYEPSHYECSSEAKDILQNSHFWKLTVEQDKKFVNGNLVQTETQKFLKEEYYFHDVSATLYYNNPRPLKLTKGFNSKAIAKDCANLPHKLKQKKCNEINILGDYIQTDFREGFIYIKYKALPMTEDGELYVPETQHNRLEEYILYFLKWKVAEDLLLNNDDSHMASKVQYLATLTQDAFMLASTELKFSTLDPKRTWKDIQQLNRREHRKYEILYPNLTRRHY